MIVFWAVFLAGEEGTFERTSEQVSLWTTSHNGDGSIVSSNCPTGTDEVFLGQSSRRSHGSFGRVLQVGGCQIQDDQRKSGSLNNLMFDLCHLAVLSGQTSSR